MTIVAFDVDDTLFHKVKYMGVESEMPDYRIIDILLWHLGNRDQVIVWSGGGVDYAQRRAHDLGVLDRVTVVAKGSIRPDIAYDDQEVNLGTVNIKVRREYLCPHGWTSRDLCPECGGLNEHRTIN